MSHPLNINAYEIRQLMHAQPIVGTVQRTVMGVIKLVTKMNLAKQEVVDEVWW